MDFVEFVANRCGDCAIVTRIVDMGVCCGRLNIRKMKSTFSLRDFLLKLSFVGDGARQ